MLLFTQRNAIDTRLTLISEAIFLNDIVDFRSSNERKWSLQENSFDWIRLFCIGEDALIFVSNKPNVPYKIRYPSQCLQCAWQTILEQRLKTWQRSIHDESSSADSDLEWKSNFSFFPIQPKPCLLKRIFSLFVCWLLPLQSERNFICIIPCYSRFCSFVDNFPLFLLSLFRRLILQMKWVEKDDDDS